MADAGFEILELSDGQMSWAPRFLAASAADRILTDAQQQISWERHRLRIFGREVAAPRSSCWIGDPDAIYTYSRVRFEPRPWPVCLLSLRAQIAHACAEQFNCVLANRYVDGSECMGWHADDERELGTQPVIASLSLGATRRFVLRHRRSGKKLELALEHGSLLVMRGQTQRHWEHCLPRTARAVGLRINLTFRRILVPAAA